VKSAFKAVWSEIEEPLSSIKAKDQAGLPTATASLVHSNGRISQQGSRGAVGLVGSMASPTTADAVPLRSGSNVSSSTVPGKHAALANLHSSTSHTAPSTSSGAGMYPTSHNPHLLSRETGLSVGRVHHNSSSSNSTRHTAAASLQIIKAGLVAGMGPLSIAAASGTSGLAGGTSGLGGGTVNADSPPETCSQLESARGRASALSAGGAGGVTGGAQRQGMRSANQGSSTKSIVRFNSTSHLLQKVVR
jgi:hypothetical protein